MNDILFGILLGVLSSLVASALFLWGLSKLKPNMEISSKIAKLETADKQTTYSIKVINRTPCELMNVRVKLYLEESRKVPGAPANHFLWERKEIELKRDEIIFFAKYDKKDSSADYACRFVTYVELEKEGNGMDMQSGECQESRLLFHVHACHSRSGFGKVFSQTYEHRSGDIIHGDFNYGASLDIVQSAPNPQETRL